MRVHQIDAMRGLAALSVAAIFHIHNLIGGYRTSPLDGIQPFTWIHDNGWTLVDLFFVISGYIFAEIYLREGQLKCSIRDFAIARFARLYPLHLVTLLAMLLLVLCGFQSGGLKNDAWHFALNLVMLQESGLNARMSFNYPTWSISVEVFCYFIFAVAARFGILKYLAPVMIAVGIYLTFGPGESADHIGRGFVGFFTGTIIQRQGSQLSRPALVAIACVSLLLPRLFNVGAQYSLSLWPATVLLALKTPLKMQWLGDRSYSIYLIHAPLFAAGTLLLGRHVPHEQQLLVMVLGIGLLLVLSDLSFRYFEEPARVRIRAFSMRATSRQGLAAPEHGLDAG